MAKSMRPTPGELSESPSGSEDWESSSIAAIPDDLLQTVLVDQLEAPDLSRLCCVSRRWQKLGGCEALWETLFIARWGEPSALTRRAAKLAKGWKRLYASKDKTDKTSAPWTKPCPEEVAASVEKLGRRLTPTTPVAVVFLIDGSGSVNAEEFEAMLGFVLDASSQLHGMAPDCQVAVVQFSNDVKVEAPLGPVDMEGLQRVKREMVRMNGGTNVAVAVQKAGQLLKRDAPVDAHRQVVLLTDGRVDSYQAHEARHMAEQLADEQRHVSLFAYGVGRGVDRAELLHIIGGPPTCTVTLAGAAAAAAAAASAGAGAAGGGGADGGVERAAGGGGVSLSAWGEDPEDRYLALCVRDEAPW